MSNKIAVWIAIGIVAATLIFLLFFRKQKTPFTSDYKIKTDEELQKYLHIEI